MQITWIVDNPDTEFSERDEEGNVYSENACRETVAVTTPQGHTGSGRTPEEALRNARKEAALWFTEDYVACVEGATK